MFRRMNIKFVVYATEIQSKKLISNERNLTAFSYQSNKENPWKFSNYCLLFMFSLENIKKYVCFPNGKHELLERR